MRRFVGVALPLAGLFCLVPATATGQQAKEKSAGKEAQAQPKSEKAAEAPKAAGDSSSKASSKATIVDEESPATAKEVEPIDVSIFGGREVQRVAGSAHKVGKKQLERFEDDNIERTLSRVPGVYVRGEDGYGLRPNIGLRGASSDRSKKITLMEDGVLFGPAPYSAPAAYYFPLSTRMVGLEVFKGPSAIRYGPQTIGGAVNMVSRRIPWGHEFGADLAAGNQVYSKQHLHYGWGGEKAGFLLEGARLRSDGFKQIDGAGVNDSTGFDKMEFMAKGRVNNAPDSRVYQEARVKLGYSRELSNETYLGLSDADFRASPFRRYAASQLDNMQWERTLVELSHGLVLRGKFRLTTTLYRHDFHRVWFKVNRFADGPLVPDILAQPSGGQRAVYYDVLTGAQDSNTSGQTLMLGANDRTFVSQGIQSNGRLDLPALGPVEQRLQFGLRFHHDSIRRLHTEDSYRMQAGRLEADGAAQRVNADNVGNSYAFSAFAVDEIAFKGLLVTPGIRFEFIRTSHEDNPSRLVTDGQQVVLLPGAGAIYRFNSHVSVLGGVHLGFGPVAPQLVPQGETAPAPEESLNYELGARINAGPLKVELVGFASDYRNLTGQCAGSSGCAEVDRDRQYNFGQALIYGVEAVADAVLRPGKTVEVPVNASYTFTRTRFLESFSSSNPQFGEVKAGDELPYIPGHQVALSSGVDVPRWGGVFLAGTFVDAMRESAGQGDDPASPKTDPAFVLDLAARAQLTSWLQLYGKVGNLLDNRYIVSRRPLGARPGQARFGFAGLKVMLRR